MAEIQASASALEIKCNGWNGWRLIARAQPTGYSGENLLNQCSGSYSILRFHLDALMIEFKRSITNVAHGSAQKRCNRQLQVCFVTIDRSVNVATRFHGHPFRYHLSKSAPVMPCCFYHPWILMSRVDFNIRYLWRLSSHPSWWRQKPTSRSRGPNINAILHYNRYNRPKMYSWKTRP